MKPILQATIVWASLLVLVVAARAADLSTDAQPQPFQKQTAEPAGGHEPTTSWSQWWTGLTAPPIDWAKTQLVAQSQGDLAQ
jgi:hypothetical protein